ncbi:MAG: hypothetical protein HZA46_14480 [Planctomycetales bacterium]|nr:hypothetical protein [Planctomycetales bacterium]
MSIRLRGLNWIVLCLAAAGLGDRPAVGQTRQIHIEVESSTPAARSLAPVLVVWKVTSQSSNLIEGHFEITIADDREVLAQIVTEDLVLSAGQQTIRTLLPPLDSVTFFPELTLHVVFVGKRGERLDVGKHLLRVPPITQRGLVVGVSHPWQSAASPALDALLQSLRLEDLLPKPDEGRPTTIGTSHARIAPGELPQTALAYCVFDMLLLSDDGFSSLKAPQLTAILDWVRSGGSVCVVPGRMVLSPTHASFLNALAGTTASTPPYLLDSTGHIMPPDETTPDGDAATPAMSQTYRVGLGRAVVALGNPERAATWWASPAWREAVAFLWKVRADQVASLTADPAAKREASQAAAAAAKAAVSAQAVGAGASAAEQPDSAAQQGFPIAYPPLPMPGMAMQVGADTEDYNKFLQYAPIPIHTIDQLLLKLMPQSMRVMPLSLMMFLLSLYVVVIGPGDYFGLGWIRRRKWTWVLFPTVTIGFALFILWLSQWYLGIADNRRALTVLDLGDDGRVVRQNRLELVITGSSRAVTTPVKQAFFTPLAHHHFGGSMTNQMQFAGAVYASPGGGLAGGFNPNQRDATDPGPTQYSGRVPSQFTALQNLPQWTPRMNRQLGISPGDSEVAVDWEAIRRLLPDGKPKPHVIPYWHDPLHKELAARFGNRAWIYFFHGSDEVIRRPPGESRYTATNPPGDPFSDNVNPYGNRVLVTKTVTTSRGQQTVQTWEHQQTTTSFLRDLCAVKQVGLLSIVSQISPSGGHTFDDLTMLDPSDDRQWLIVVFVPQGEDFVMYRKLIVK